MKKSVIWFLRIVSILAMIVGGLVFAYEMWWLAACDNPTNNFAGLEIIWRAECLPIYLGAFGQKIGDVIQTIAEYFWYHFLYKEASIAIFLTGLTIFVLSFYSKKSNQTSP